MTPFHQGIKVSNDEKDGKCIASSSEKFRVSKDRCETTSANVFVPAPPADFRPNTTQRNNEHPLAFDNHEVFLETREDPHPSSSDTRNSPSKVASSWFLNEKSPERKLSLTFDYQQEELRLSSEQSTLSYSLSISEERDDDVQKNASSLCHLEEGQKGKCDTVWVFPTIHSFNEDS